MYLKEKQQLKDQTNTVVNEDFLAVVSKVNMIGDDVEWWINSGATRHIACSRNLFKTYEEDDNGEKLFMGNLSVAKV